MIRKLQFPCSKLFLLLIISLGLVVASRDVSATATTRTLLLPNHKAEEAYKMKFSPAQNPSKVMAAYNHAQTLPVASALPAVRTWHPAVGAPTTNNMLSTANSLPPSSFWTPVGPAPLDSNVGTTFDVGSFGPNGGRTLGIVVDPATSGATTLLYVGAEGGGVWVSASNGANWWPVTDGYLPTGIIGAIAMDPVYPNILYVGTGEGNSCGDCAYGLGMFKSTDWGATWTQIGGNTFVSTSSASIKFNKIVINPTNHLEVWAAARQGMLYKSTNGGSTFSLVSIPNVTGVASMNIDDLIVNGGSVYVSASTRFSYNSANGLYLSPNGGVTWWNLTPVVDPALVTNLSQNGPYGRAAIAQAKTNPNILYLFVSNPDPTGAKQGDLYAAYTTANYGSSWTKISQPTGTNGSSYPFLGSMPAQSSPTDPCSADGAYGATGQCWYDIDVGIDPGNANIVYFGGVDTALSIDGGKTFKNITKVYDAYNPGPVHPDQHGIAFNNAVSIYNGISFHTVYFVNDGGVYSSSNGGVTFSNLNTNFNTLESYYAAGGTNYANQRLLWNGMQDNGTGKFTGNVQWEEMFGGDGGFTAIDPTNQKNAWEEYTNATVNSTTDGGISWYPSNFVGSTGCSPSTPPTACPPGAQFIAPFQLDPNATLAPNHLHLIVGAADVWETTDGTNYCDVTPSLGTSLAAIAMAPSTQTLGSEYVYFADASGHVFRATNGGVTPLGTTCGSTWSYTEIDPGTLPGYITDLAVDPGNANTLYATFAVNDSSVAIAIGTNHIYKAIYNGTSWTWTALSEGSSAGQLPVTNYNSVVTYDTPTGSVVIVGGDQGVYLSINGGTSWSALKTGLPPVQIYKLRMDYATSTLIASTHGRSVWTMPIPQATAVGDGYGDTVGVYHTGNTFIDPTTFLLRNELSSGIAEEQAVYGSPNDSGLVGDWDGDGIATVGIYRKSTNTFYLKNSNAGGTPLAYTFTFGQPGDLPVVGDWTHGGHDMIGVYRPGTGQFLLRTSFSAGPPDITITFGGINVNNRPFAGDFNGEGTDTVGVYDTSTGVFSYTNTICATVCTPAISGSGTITGSAAGDLPATGDWTHSGTDGIGIYHQSNGTFYLNNAMSSFSTTSANFTVAITGSASSDLPLAGHFNNNNNAPYIAPKYTTPSTAPGYVPPSN